MKDGKGYKIRTVYIEDWQDKIIRENNINFSKLIRDILTEYFKKGHASPLAVKKAQIETEIEELETKLKKIAEEYTATIQRLQKELAELKEEIRLLKAEKQTTLPTTTTTLEEEIKNALLDLFKDVNYNPENLKKTVKDVTAAVKARVFMGVPKRLGRPVSPIEIEKVIMKYDELAFLRPYLK